MNILFYTHGKVYATKGGTERTTVSVASALTRLYGCRCYSLYEAEEAVEGTLCKMILAHHYEPWVHRGILMVWPVQRR